VRRPIALTILIVLAIGGVVWLRNYKALSPPNPQSGVEVSSWNSGMGAVSSNNFNEQKLSFTANVWNNTNHTVYITGVAVNLPDSLRNHVLSGGTLVAVNKSLAPNAKYKITGQFILDTKQMTKEQIVSLGGIQGFTVNTTS
jgi:hypothetical protein